MLWICTSLCSQHFLYILYRVSLTSPCILSIHIVFGLPLPLFPLILASNNSLCTIFGLLIKCPKYSHFLFLMIFINFRLVFIILSTSPLGLCSFQDILNICRYVHISKASILFEVLKYSLEQYIGFVGRQAFIHYCGLHQV